ncbi:Zn-ribbon domain-containing OB-fold protein [Elusimicrobiota bacterium]
METLTKEKLFGTNLRSRDFRTGNVAFETFKPKLEYNWDCGIAMGKFFEGLKKGKIMATYCSKCKRTLVPPRVFCEKCFRDIDKWVTIKDTGIIQTFSVCYTTWNMKRLKTPQIPAVVAIDGATPGYGFMHMIKVKDWKTLKIGDKVKAVWKPKAQRKGAITDIKYFVKVD